jgi:serine protease Do
MRVRTFWIVSLFLLAIFSCLRAQGKDTFRFYPLPLAELEQIVSRWLVDSDFQVSRTKLDSGKVLLIASNERGACQFTLKPHSALAAEIMATCVLKDRDRGTVEQELWTYLSLYVRHALSGREDDNQDAPLAVSSKSQSVVCIHAKLENEAIQFSGFLIDPEGLIISTAHDLGGVTEINVTLHDGREFQGYLLKTDSYRDLALIDIRVRVNTIISLSKGRNLLRNGERLYSIGCSGTLKGAVHSAVVIDPPRRMNNLPLWQATMKALPGSSGSPVFDLQGNLVGMVKGRYRGTDSVGFFIPLETILEFLREASK